jgi:L-ectoine synthase
MDGTEHEIVPGTLYALDQHDCHDLVADDAEDLRLVCMFTPALTGDEAHHLTESGIHSSVY